MQIAIKQFRHFCSVLRNQRRKWRDSLASLMLPRTSIHYSSKKQMTCNNIKGDHASLLMVLTTMKMRVLQIAHQKPRICCTNTFRSVKRRSRNKLTNVTGLFSRTKMVPKQQYKNLKVTCSENWCTMRERKPRIKKSKSRFLSPKKT